MNDRLSDDAFAARLREVTADVPSSRLDLEAVFASSRRKAVRHGAGVGALCVAAVAVAGIGVPQIVPLLPDGPASAALVVSPGTGDDTTPPATCDPADVEVTWQRETVRPIVARVERTVYDGDSHETSQLVSVDWEQRSPSVSGAIGSEMEAGILRAAAETEGSGFRFTEGSVTSFEPDHADPPRRPDALEGFSGADEASPRWHGFDSLDEPAPGTYIFYAAGDEHLAFGVASCDDDSKSFRLSYWSIDESGTIECTHPVDDNPLGVYLKLAYCDVPLTAAERAAVGLSPDGSLENLEAFVSQFRIGTDE